MAWICAPAYLIVKQPKGVAANKKKATREVVAAFKATHERHVKKMLKQTIASAPVDNVTVEYALYKEVVL